MSTIKTDVIIIGAGPTGLMAANQLQRHGINFKIIDYKSGPTIESRALAVTARSMEVYQQLNLDQIILDNAVQVKGFELYLNGKKKIEISMANIGEGLSDFPNMMTIFEQHDNEKLLYENLKQLGGEVNWDCKCETIQQGNDLIEIETTKEGIKSRFQAKYLIGCDGASSIVRKSQNFSFKGGTYENIFFVANAELEAPFGKNHVIISPNDNIFSAFFPMQGKKRFRVVGTLPIKYAHKKDIKFSDIEQAIETSSKLEIDYKEVDWFSSYKLHHRCVDSFSKGNIFLAGDSAHIHSPAGGQGMNTGLIDAHNLAWKLAWVIKGFAKPEILETYNEERLPFARWLLGFTDRGFQILSSPRWYLNWFRKYIVVNVIPIVLKFKRARLNGFKILSQTWFTYHKRSLNKSFSTQKLKFKAGDRMPYTEKSCYKNLDGSTFFLLHLTRNPLDGNPQKGPLDNFKLPVKYVNQQISSEWQKLGVKEEIFILIRPDQHILCIADKLNDSRLIQHLELYFN